MQKTILYAIETSGPGGAEKMLINLVESLDKKRFRPLIVLLQTGWLDDQLRSRGHQPFIFPLDRMIDIGWLRKAASLIKAEDVNVLHAHEFYMNTYCALLSRFTGVPCVTTVHGRNYYPEKWYRRSAYRMASKHSAMVAVSNGIRDFLQDTVGISGSNLITIRNGIDVDTYTSVLKLRTTTRNEIGLTQEQPVIGCLGNLYPVKGHTYLVQAAATICQRYPDSVFLFAGRGKMLESLQRQAVQLGVERNMRFLGFRDDTPMLLAAMDLFVLPSLSEGLPLSLLEAMAACKPIIASAVGGIPEVIVHEKNGLLVKQADAQALAESVLLLLDNRDLASTIAQQAQKDVIAHHNVTAMTKTYEALYESLLRRDKRGLHDRAAITSE